MPRCVTEPFTDMDEAEAKALRRRTIVPGDDPVELRPVRRMTFDRKPTVPGIKGGQMHSGADLEAAILPIVIGILACAGIVVAALLKAAS